MQQVSSPCIRQCCLNESDVCIGCGRLLSEILKWSDTKANDQQQIVELAKKRREQLKSGN